MHDRPPPAALREQVALFFKGFAVADDVLAAIAAHIEPLIDATSLSQRLDAWVRLVDWARSGPGSAELDHSGLLSQRAFERWTLLLDFLDAHAAVRSRVQAALGDIFSETEGVNLFGVAGLPGGRGFAAEFGDRLVRHLLPDAPEEHDLARLLHRLYRSKAHVERFVRLPPELFSRIADLVRPAAQPQVSTSLRNDFADGFRLLAARAQAEGLAAKLRARSPPVRVAQSPFACQARVADELLRAWVAEGSDANDVIGAAQAWREQAAACRAVMVEIARRLETEGVSVDIVFGLDAIERCLTRMDVMVGIMERPAGPERNLALHSLLSLLMAAVHQDRSVRHLVRANLRLLQRKIVERAGKTGEHYIAWTRREYWQLWAAAAGGGALTTLTAAMKMMIAGAGLALFVEGFAAGLNYAASFLLLQLFGLVLATKQPAMTAATLARFMRDERGTRRTDVVADYAVQICRSQLAAAIANVALVSIGAVALSYAWILARGHPFLDHHQALHVFETLSPVNSGTIWYAALTGVVLWAASLVGGWFDNWAVYHRLPQAIAEHRLGQRFGRKRMTQVAGVVSRNVSGWATNVSLGFMLGLTPVLGAFFGLPLDVRHVTLSSGMLALAAVGLGGEWLHGGWFLWALCGIATMFVLNLGVSFLLSLYTAARAYDLPRSFMLDFARAVGRRLLRHPGDFVLPPARDAAAPDVH